MIAARARRTERRAGADPFRLTARDRWLLEAVGKMRYVTTGQCARLAFEGSRWAAQKRLRRLYDAGYVRAWVPRLDGENLYTLSRAGALVVDGAYPVPRGLDNGRLSHRLGVNDIRIALILSVPAEGGELLWWRDEAPVGSRLVADALFAVRWGDGVEGAYFLEYENRTRGPRAFVRKLLAYGQGRRHPVLVVGRDPRWLDRYRAAAQRFGVTQGVWFTTLKVLEEGAPAVWEDAAGRRKVSLRSVVTGRRVEGEGSLGQAVLLDDGPRADTPSWPGEIRRTR